MPPNFKIAKLPPLSLDHYRVDALAIVDDAVNILDIIVNQWKSIILPLLDSSRPNSLASVTISESQELHYER